MLGKVLILIVFLIAIFSIDHLASDDDDSVFNTIIEWKQAFFEAPETMMLSSLRDDFLHNNMSLLPHQTDYIVELTQKHQDVLDFHKLYCVGGDKNPYLFGADLDKFCGLIQTSGVLSFDWGK